MCRAGGLRGRGAHLNFAHGYLNGYIFEQAVSGQPRPASSPRELTEALQGEFDTLGLTCPIDWSAASTASAAQRSRSTPATVAWSLRTRSTSTPTRSTASTESTSRSSSLERAAGSLAGPAALSLLRIEDL